MPEVAAAAGLRGNLGGGGLLGRGFDGVGGAGWEWEEEEEEGGGTLLGKSRFFWVLEYQLDEGDEDSSSSSFIITFCLVFSSKKTLIF